ncbi:MAG: phage holin family protein [Clostridia bacterium]|nr:phage holin family protein [Clostridia bacterium]
MNLSVTGEGAARLTLSAIAALVLAEFCYYAPALLLLIGVMVLDYVTGLAKGWLTGELSSARGLRGVVKKLCYLLGVAAGFAADLALSLAAEGLGLAGGLPAYFGLLVTLMLATGELISVLENLGTIGVPMPKALRKALLKLHEQNEEQEEDAT